MFSIDSIVLYVENLQQSMDFYQMTFDCEVEQLSPTFASVVFGNVKVTLKEASALSLASEIKGGGSELSIKVVDKIELERLYQTWKSKNIQFAQGIEAAVYGFSFVALDPDRHRIRIFS